MRPDSGSQPEAIVSLLTFIVSKIAVGIFAGGVVFATLLPELQINTPASWDKRDVFAAAFILVAIAGAYSDVRG